MAGEINFGQLDPGAVMRGAQQTNALLQSWAQTRAGKAIARGDRQAALGELNSTGQLAEARTVQSGFNAEDDRMRAMDEAKKAEAAKFLTEVTGALGRVRAERGDAAVLPAFDQLVPIFQQRGAKPEELATYRSALQANPAAFIDAMSTKAKEELDRYSFMTVGGSVVRGNKETGEAAPVFTSPQYKAVGAGQDLVEIPGSVGGAAAPASPAPAAGPSGPLPHSADVAALVESAFPGAVITGMGRTPDRNAEVGGVPNSMHLDDMAIDIRPIPGVTLEQAVAALRAKGIPVTEAIHEKAGLPGDHYHIGWRPEGGTAPAAPAAPVGGARVIASNPKEATPTDQWRPATPAEAAQYGAVAGQLNARTGQFVPTPRSATPAAAAGAKPGAAPKLSPQDSIFISKTRTAANEAQTMVNLLTEFGQLNRDVETGGLMALPGAKALGAVNPKISRMVAISSQLTPAMRNGLPGAASDRDVAMFRAATVSIDKPREANEAIVRAAKAFGARQGDYVAFIEDYARKNGSLLGAQEEWQAYAAANPLFSPGRNGSLRLNRVVPWRQYFSGQAQAAAPPAGGGTVRRYNPATGRIE